MPVTAESLIAPAGELEPDLFPSDVSEDGDRSRLLARVKAYIDSAPAAAAGNDPATSAWAYHRAYRAVYISMSANPVRASEEGQGSAQFDPKQADRFLALSNSWLAVYEGEIGEGAPAETPTGLPGSLSQRAGFEF